MNEKVRQLSDLEAGIRKVIAENGEALSREPGIAEPLKKASGLATEKFDKISEGRNTMPDGLIP